MKPYQSGVKTKFLIVIHKSNKGRKRRMGVHTLIGRNQIPLTEQRQRCLQNKQNSIELAAERVRFEKMEGRKPKGRRTGKTTTLEYKILIRFHPN